MTTLVDGTAVAVSRQLQRVAGVLARCVERGLAPVGVTLPQVAALDLVARADGPMTVTRLASELGWEQQGLTGLLDRLEKQDLVRRVRDLPDRRAIRLELTEAGEAKLAAARPAEEACATALVADLSPEQLVWLTAALEAVEQRAQ